MEQRDITLEGIRGLAILMVLVVHCIEITGNSAWATWTNALVRSCWLGVDLFFVLSGYLITRILIETREKPNFFKNFFARRALRIFPAYYLYLAVVFWFLPAWIPALQGGDVRGWALPNFLYLQNFVMVIEGMESPWRGLNHLWSLAVEEQFYLIWPLLVWATPLRKLEWLSLGMIFVAWSFKFGLLTLNDWPMASYVLMPSRMDALAAGSWVAARIHASEDRLPTPIWIRFLVAFAVLILIGMFIRYHGLRLSGAYRIVLITSSAALGFGALLYVCITRRLRPVILCSLPLQIMGRYSYGIYLIHIAVIDLLHVGLQRTLISALGANPGLLLSAFITIIVTIAMAAIMFHLYEEPFLRLKRYFSS